MTGIIAAGGLGSRLAPVTEVVNKHLLLVYDKPMIYYSLSLLMSAGIRDIVIVSTTRGVNIFKELLGDGSWLGMRLRYAEQSLPRGAAEAFLLAERMIDDDYIALLLGDNIFLDYGDSGALKKMLMDAQRRVMNGREVIFTQDVVDPKEYGVVEVDRYGKPVSIEEKPAHPRSHLAITGLYFYTKDVLRIAHTLSPSARGELEMRDVNRAYMKQGRLDVVPLHDDVVWRDAGTAEGILAISQAVAQRQNQTGRLIGVVEETAFLNGWIEKEDVSRLAAIIGSNYGRYLETLERD